jgi:hypothetical protein
MGTPDTADPMAAMLGPMLRGMGVDPDALTAMFEVDPDAPDLTSVLERLDALDAGLDVLAEQLTELSRFVSQLGPILELANAVKANAGKLARFGLNV